jgi:3'-5' exoribonuclease
MKSHFVTDLADGQLFTSLFLVREKEVRNSARTGASWLQLELVDRTGTICAKMWDNFAALTATFDCDDVIQIRARVKLYNGRKELAVEQIVPAAERDYDLADFLPHTKRDVAVMYAELRAAVGAMRNPFLKQLVSSIIDDPAIVPKLKRAPAAMTMHHAYLGGLLEHVVSLVGLARAVSAHYPELDPDLLLAGVVLHDIGKIDELRYARAIDYSHEGQLLGHIMIGVSLVRDKRKLIPGFPPALGALVDHLILSHHGTHEFGSPALPKTPEALALHFIDDFDSKMAAMRATLEASCLDGDLWTERNPALRRSLLRTDKFLAADVAPASDTCSSGDSASGKPGSASSGSGTPGASSSAPGDPASNKSRPDNPVPGDSVSRKTVPGDFDSSNSGRTDPNSANPTPGNPSSGSFSFGDFVQRSFGPASSGPGKLDKEGGRK